MKAVQNISNFDSATRHFLGNYPQSLPIEKAYVHIGMYLGWIIETGLYSEYFAEEGSAQIFRFKRREISCTILSQIWDGNIPAEILNNEGKAFSAYYYSTGLFRQDYHDVLAKNLPSFYHVADNWQNYERLKLRLDQRFTCNPH
jgi:hypothetical protein